MARDLFKRYFWLVDTIRRRGAITKRELDSLWAASPYSGGEDKFCRRTFYNYRQDIEDIFNIKIQCNQSTFEYYIDEDSDSESVSNWLLNSAAVNDVLSDARQVSDRIFLEEVNTTREQLATFVDAIKQSRRVSFTYNNFTRSRPTHGIIFETYFLKIFKQRWYAIGLVVADKKIKTYALDRITDLNLTGEEFVMDKNFNAADWFKNAFGIVVTQSEPKDVIIKTDHLQAKYFRALPLHHSQEEYIHDNYSLFHYKLTISNDFVSELLSHGPKITVIQPPELKAMIVKSLKQSLDNYSD